MLMNSVKGSTKAQGFPLTLHDVMGDSRNTGRQPYKYIGKELDRTHGLDLYAHGARHYAPCPPIPLLNFRLARPRHRCTHADQK